MSGKTVEEVARAAAIDAADAFIAEWATPVLHVEFGAASRHALILGIEAATLPALRQREQETAQACADLAGDEMEAMEALGPKGDSDWVNGGCATAQNIAARIISRFPKDQG